MGALLPLLASCTPPGTGDRGPVTLSVQIATRQSCGALSGLDYDTSCAAALDVVVRDAATLLPVPGKEVCRPVSNKNTLGDILGEPIIDITGLSTNTSVIFEVRGLHNSLAEPEQDPCHDAFKKERWLFWGESGVVDLRTFDAPDGGAGPSPIVRVVVDCRDCSFACGEDNADTCFGCGGFGAQCPAEFPVSFCVPAVTCGKSCSDKSQCFGGARECVNGFCDTSTITGQLCSPCGGAAQIGCGEGLTCVKKSGGEGFCAFPCPADNCVSGTKCNRLHNNLERAD